MFKLKFKKRTLVGVAAAGLFMAGLGGGAALANSGLKSNAGSSKFVGGSASQSLQGATLENIDYWFADSSNSAVNQITLTFAEPPPPEGVTVEALINNSETVTCAIYNLPINTQYVCSLADPVEIDTVKISVN